MLRRLAVAVAVLLVAACRGTAERPGLVVLAPVGPYSVVPNTSNEEFTLSVLGNVYEPLVRLGADLSPQPALAESWHSPDDLTWVFRLREGVRLHDGRLLDAAQAAACLERARRGPYAWYQGLLGTVDSVTASGPLSIVVRTVRPDDLLPARLGSIQIWAPPQRAGAAAVGTGPYRPRAWAQGGNALLEAAPGYRSGPPPIPLVEYRVVPDAGERARRVARGEADLTLDVPAEQMPSLASVAGVRTVAVNGLRVFFLLMDCGGDLPPGMTDPFHDRRVREAVALAIDRAALVDRVLGGYSEVIDQIASPQELGGAAQALPRRPFDPARARKLLAEAGYPKGFRMPLDYLTKYRAVDEVTRKIAEDLAAVGIEVVRRGTATLDLERFARREVLFTFGGWTSDTGEASTTYANILHSRTEEYGRLNGMHYANPEVDRLIEQALRQRRAGERAALLGRVARLVYEDLPMIPLYRQADLYVVARDLEFTPRLDRLILASSARWRTGARPAPDR